MKKAADDFISPLKPAEPAPPKKPPIPAPAWMALAGAWMGLIALAAAIAYLFLPGSKQPRAELERLAPYSLADRFIPVPMYGIAIGLTFAILVLWQMRRMPRPLPDALVMQRVQAWIGIILALVATTIMYVDVAIRGPK